MGGLPNISRPIRMTLAANHTAPITEPSPTRIESQICQNGGGELEAIRSSMAKVFMGGMKLTMTLNTESGLRDIGNQRIQGIINVSDSGIISPCASFISLTAEPTAIIREPITR